MKQVNMHEAKTHLSRLVEGALNGEPFVIARAGKPLVKVVPVEAPARPSRFGFLSGGAGTVTDASVEEFKALDEEIWAGYEDKSLFPPGYDEQGNKLDETAEDGARDDAGPTR